MAKEPERRFLVRDGFAPEALAFETETLAQSYLPDTGAWVIRIRRWTGEHGAVAHWLTLKRPLTDVTNLEFEPPITEEMYEDIMTATGAEVLKTRYGIRHAGKVWEVDVFGDPSVEPGMIAEVELSHEGEEVSIPPWAGREVTGDRWYSNAQIAARLEESKKEHGNG